MKKKKDKNFASILIWYVLLVCIIVLTVIIFWPDIVFITLGNLEKVPKNSTNLNRLELLKLLISIISPVLTFIVFQNTLGMQKKLDKRHEKEKKRDFYMGVREDFIFYLDNFKKIQDNIFKNVKIEDIENQIKTNGEPSKDLTIMLDKKDLGTYFRCLYLILKKINSSEKKITTGEYDSFIEVLRTQISRGEFIIILRQALVEEVGYKLARQLVETDFFGKNSTMKRNGYEDLIFLNSEGETFIAKDYLIYFTKKSPTKWKKIPKVFDKSFVHYVNKHLKGGDK